MSSEQRTYSLPGLLLPQLACPSWLRHRVARIVGTSLLVRLGILSALRAIVFDCHGLDRDGL